MDTIVLLLIIFSSLFFSLSDILQNKSVKYFGPFGHNIISQISISILLFIVFIFLFFYKKPFHSLYIPNLHNNLDKIYYPVLSGIFVTLTILMIGVSFYHNNKLKIPINLGILTAILSMNFVFTIIIEEIQNFIQKKPIKIKLAEIIGIISIIIGIIIISFNS